MAGQKTDARDVHVGRRIAEQRKKASLTQKRVAERFGMSAAQLQKYEKGTNRISALHLESFSRMIGVPVTYFFEDLVHTDAEPDAAFHETPQQPYVAGDSWQGLVDVVARHVTEHFSEERRRELSAAIQALDAKLKR
ncbi:helix-turn-helix domain-containing protein [Methylobacterium sp. J-090]|uniref:helix-turn-helix domain-containing protein n=1 Tax=Methylobacterium sp. J-090 TaxID=2836666 RepID=UPI001FB8A55B|nr:helix-turn-helix transcriptional regulator [Methylobacterium sp. J-090]MCJ2082733.1 helix-turn-helix domain-containing protein [Methylobacterium sp. J-090]